VNEWFMELCENFSGVLAEDHPARVRYAEKVARYARCEAERAEAERGWLAHRLERTRQFMQQFA
jgi:hypothetical protein